MSQTYFTKQSAFLKIIMIPTAHKRYSKKILYKCSLLRFKRIDVVGHKNFRDVYDPIPDNNDVKKRIREIVAEMRQDVNKGDFIRKKPYPDRYRKLDVANLYVYPLPGANRLIYTIRTTKEDKIYQYVDLLTHKEYDVLFGYNTS